MLLGVLRSKLLLDWEGLLSKGAGVRMKVSKKTCFYSMLLACFFLSSGFCLARFVNGQGVAASHAANEKEARRRYEQATAAVAALEELSKRLPSGPPLDCQWETMDTVAF